MDQPCASLPCRGSAAADALLAYLLTEYADDGSSRSAPDNIQFYYKAPATLNYAGERGRALRSLNQLTMRFGPEGRLDLSSDGFAEPWTAYIAGWAAWGAGMLGRFDIARHMMTAAADYRDPATGAYKVGRDEASPRDVQRTGAALMGLVWAGAVEEAAASAEFLRTLLDRQPSPQQGFSAQMDSGGEVLPAQGDPNCFFDFDDPRARPAMFATGIAGLVWLYRRTGDDGVLATARNYLRVVESHRGDPARLGLATKIGWAAMMVHAHLPEPALAGLAGRAAVAQAAQQRPDGAIDYARLEGAEADFDRIWMVGWGCDSLLTLLAVANGEA